MLKKPFSYWYPLKDSAAEEGAVFLIKLATRPDPTLFYTDSVIFVVYYEIIEDFKDQTF